MAGTSSAHSAPGGNALQEPAWLRWALIATCMAALAAIVLLPLAVVGFEALRQGWSVYATAVIDADTRDITQTISIRKVEKKDGKLANVEFDKIPDVKDPGK